jgi:hypothetical protein
MPTIEAPTRVEAPVRIAQGVALLDERVPGWEHDVDLDTLDTSKGGFCPACQATGIENYTDARVSLGIEPPKARACGFTASNKAAYAELDRMWSDHVRASRGY